MIGEWRDHRDAIVERARRRIPASLLDNPAAVEYLARRPAELALRRLRRG